MKRDLGSGRQNTASSCPMLLVPPNAVWPLSSSFTSLEEWKTQVSLKGVRQVQLQGRWGWTLSHCLKFPLLFKTSGSIEECMEHPSAQLSSELQGCVSRCLPDSSPFVNKHLKLYKGHDGRLDSLPPPQLCHRSMFLPGCLSHTSTWWHPNLVGRANLSAIRILPPVIPWALIAHLSAGPVTSSRIHLEHVHISLFLSLMPLLFLISHLSLLAPVSSLP